MNTTGMTHLKILNHSSSRKTLRRGPQSGQQCSVKGQFNLSGVALATPTVGQTAQY